MIESGLFGNALIPFFLGVFAITNFPSILSFFALFSILSITVPTLLYLTLIIFVNLGYRFYQKCLVEKSGVIRRYAQKAQKVGVFLTMLGSFVLVIPRVWTLI